MERKKEYLVMAYAEKGYMPDHQPFHPTVKPTKGIDFRNAPAEVLTKHLSDLIKKGKYQAYTCLSNTLLRRAATGDVTWNEVQEAVGILQGGNVLTEKFRRIFVEAVRLNLKDDEERFFYIVRDVFLDHVEDKIGQNDTDPRVRDALVHRAIAFVEYLDDSAFAAADAANRVGEVLRELSRKGSLAGGVRVHFVAVFRERFPKVFAEYGPVISPDSFRDHSAGMDFGPRRIVHKKHKETRAQIRARNAGKKHDTVADKKPNKKGEGKNKKNGGKGK